MVKYLFNFLYNDSTEAYSEPCQRSKMECIAKMANGLATGLA